MPRKTIIEVVNLGKQLKRNSIPRRRLKLRIRIS
jgi:hypothetical protein